MASLMSAALKLAERGLRVFPCRPQDKRPATAHGVKDATADPGVIAAWWQQADYNIGVATGAISNIMVVDVDDVDAEAELRKLETAHGALPATVEAVTARGRHLFFKWPERDIRNSAGKIAPGIDVRGNGGYIIAPPSLHPSGRRYAWSVDSANVFAPAPAWLLDIISAPKDTAAPVMAWNDLIRDGAGVGCRNDSMTRLVGHLLHRRIDPLTTLELALAVNDARFRPPLPRAEVTAIVDSIAAIELRRRANL
jgi:Bifunctional DNA primase/polymerase, N-terminal/Primase C terminal 1 (PriCT-1)